MNGTILLTSCSPLKEEAVKAVFPKHTVYTADYPTTDESLRVEQPVGYKSGRICAKQRITAALANMKIDGPLIIISIENYIYQYDDEWYDAPHVIFADASGKTLAESPPWSPNQIYPYRKTRKVHYGRIPIQLPTIPNLSERISGKESELGWSVTTGQLIHEDNPDVPANNWHVLQGTTRVTQLKEAMWHLKCKYYEPAQYLRSILKVYPDFPKQGINFLDMNAILYNKDAAFNVLIDLLKEVCKHMHVTHIAGMESRGFILGAPLAINLMLPFVPLRKPGKLPGEIYSVDYGKEYGKDTLEVQKEAIPPGSKVLIIDDILATGGTAWAACELIRKCGAIPKHFVVITDVPELCNATAGKLKDVDYTVLL